MTHQYPAVLPPQAQETIHDIVGRLQHYLEQRETAYQELQRQNAQLSASLNTERQAHETTKKRLAEERDQTEVEADTAATLLRQRINLEKQAEELRAALLVAVAEAERANARADAAERALGEALLGVSDDN